MKDDILDAIAYVFNFEYLNKATMITVFYSNQVYGTYPTLRDLRHAITSDSDVYQGGYLYATQGNGGAWYRLDLTPIHDAEVPVELKAYILLMG